MACASATSPCDVLILVEIKVKKPPSLEAFFIPITFFLATTLRRLRSKEPMELRSV